MNIMTVTKDYYDQIVNNIRFRCKNIEYINENCNMYKNGEFAFNDGLVCIGSNPAFEFRRCIYSGEEKSENGKEGFLFCCQTSNGLVKVYFNISITYNTEFILDWYLEPVNSAAQILFDSYSSEEIIFTWFYKILLPFDKIQRKALKEKKRIIKIQNNIEREFKERNATVSSNVIMLSGDIKYQCVNIYNDTRPYHRHTDSWDVRGHYRHYKSGKVVYISPHTKGTGVKNDKTYAITV